MPLSASHLDRKTPENGLAPLPPAAETALREIGLAVEPLFRADEPAISRDARSLFRRLVPDVTRNPHLRGAVPKLVTSLLDSLERLGPKYELQKRSIAVAWQQVERASKDQRAI
jgi:hypothetical protein